jgi:HSP90 family molecular chaperone
LLIPGRGRSTAGRHGQFALQQQIDLPEHIGTIYRSGFLKAQSGGRPADAGLIDKFGVGFHSSFMVAEQVVPATRRAGLPAVEAVRAKGIEVLQQPCLMGDRA